MNPRMNPRMTHSIARFGLVSVLAAGFLFAAQPAAADDDECREAAGKVAGSFAKKRAKHLLDCADASGCDAVKAAARAERLRSRSLRKLASACEQATGPSLGLGGACPDPTGRCTQSIGDPVGLVDCMLCLVAETLDPLLHVLQGADAEVAATCGGCSAAACREGAFCESPPGVCDASPEVGICTDVPQACPDNVDPVCGCDGQTYSNDCERRASRVGLHHRGACKTHCGSAAGDVCPDDTFCEGLPGHCGTTPEGTCVPLPEVCPQVFRPVCGCDGETYGNDCERRAAGVRLHHHGACERRHCVFDLTLGPDGAGGDEAVCAPGEFCESPPGLCEAGLPFAPLPGGCTPIPEGCPDNVDPVCGCDGVTYGNDCERQSAGVSKEHDGRCESRCGGFIGEPCPEGMVCDLEPGLCGGADLVGVCVERGDFCPEIFDPVCGCNGETYPNDCFRIAAGAQLDHHGACVRDCAQDPTVCGPDERCVPSAGHCDLDAGGGLCAPVDGLCPLVVDPVCGCDGETYGNRCEAYTAGVGVRHHGSCAGDGCGAGLACPDGEVCVQLPGTCDLPVFLPVCVPAPADCNSDFGFVGDPVCGCDGVTHESVCAATEAGVAVDHPGPCFDVAP